MAMSPRAKMFRLELPQPCRDRGLCRAVDAVVPGIGRKNCPRLIRCRPLAETRETEALAQEVSCVGVIEEPFVQSEYRGGIFRLLQLPLQWLTMNRAISVPFAICRCRGPAGSPSLDRPQTGSRQATGVFQNPCWQGNLPRSESSEPLAIDGLHQPTKPCVYSGRKRCSRHNSCIRSLPTKTPTEAK
jgi:hypothetical protein